MESMRQLGAYNDAQVAALRAEMRKQVMEENQGLAKTQFDRNSFLKSQVYTNEIDSSFYSQFNTTSR